MKKILLTALAIPACAAAMIGGLLYAGVPEPAADAPHGAMVHRLIEWARERAIARRVAGIVAPADLSSPERVRRGAGNYQAMCAGCHLAPGGGDSEIRLGLYPSPPDLTREAAGADTGGRTDARRFWIIKHGIKASGMPAWSKGGMDDATIWDLTALVKALPDMSAQDYRRQVEASAGHSHSGVEHRADQKSLPQVHLDAQPHAHPATPHRH